MLITNPGLSTDELGDSGQRFVRAFGATQEDDHVNALEAFGLDGSETVEVITPPARRVGARASE